MSKLPEILTGRLYDEVLQKPAREHDQLLIVAGYASPSMASLHLHDLDDVQLNLIIGMTSFEGLSEIKKRGFEVLADEYSNFSCRCVIEAPAVHSKLFVWCREGKPSLAYIGSANYTQSAFLGDRQLEIVSLADPDACKKYYDSLIGNSAELDDYRIEKLLQLYRDRPPAHDDNLSNIEQRFADPQLRASVSLPKVTLSFLDRNGRLPNGPSGLNWGQRGRRNPNEAYIPLRAEIARQRFFPDKPQRFLVQTDDGCILHCTCAGNQGVDGALGKQIETPARNSQLGEYFRRRLGVPEGARVTLQHLMNYGRTDVDFIKLDNEDYFMDFSPPQ